LNVKRIVWTSTSLTLGPTRRGEIADEDTPRAAAHVTQYEASKAVGETLAGEYAARGSPVVIVNPGRVFGPGYFNQGNSVARIIDMYDRGRLPIVLGRRKVGNFVFVDDVVQGMILAMERGRPGERYVLGGENASLRDFFRIVDKVTGKRHFQFTIRRPAAMIFAWLQKKRADWLGIRPQLTPEWVRVFLTDWACSSAKAQRELGYQITPLEEAVARTYEWLLQVRRQQAEV
jgi:nucleoside-diphosphate-sugar epimerase